MKYLKIALLSTLVVLALAITGVTLAFAQQPAPTGSPWWESMRSRMQGAGTGRGMMGGALNNGGWQSMQQMHNQMTQNGGPGAMYAWMHQGGSGATESPVHDAVWQALADRLGLTPAELTEQINSGKTLAQIATDKGVSTQDLAATMEKAMETGLAQAVKDGQLTQEQADWMTQHMDGQYEWMIENMGAGRMGPGFGGRMGPGRGGCHDFDQTSGEEPSL